MRELAKWKLKKEGWLKETNRIIVNFQSRISKRYREKPIREYKDNKGYINSRNTGSPSNRSRIRYPRKKRKTAWKRFYKLFPHLKPETEKET